MRRLLDWYRNRLEVYRWFGFGPMYPLYRECIRRLENLDISKGIPLEEILRDYDEWMRSE